MEPQTEFADALHLAGLRLREAPVMDGRWHRAPVEGDHGLKRSARYVAYLDHHPAGFIQNFKTGYAEAWHAERPVRELTAEERRQLQEARALRDAERHTAEEAAARIAYARWMGAAPVAHHAYLERKGVGAHGLKLGHKGELLVPMRDVAGYLHNVQTIWPDGAKRFVKHGRKHGLFTQLGPIDEAKPLLIAEGYATAATLHEATGATVVVAFDSGNLLPVAEALRARRPDLAFVFAGDNDYNLPRRDPPLPNVGREKAEEAALAMGGTAIVPSFGELEAAPVGDGETPPTDWNDHKALYGDDALRSAFESVLDTSACSREMRRRAATVGRQRT